MKTEKQQKPSYRPGKPKKNRNAGSNKRSLNKAENDAASKNNEMKFIVVKSAAGLHKRNKHQGRYDFVALTHALPELKQRLVKNPKGDSSIDFSNSESVKLLNKALISNHYDVKEWDIPDGYLCPPIPGRADYIHRAADLLLNEGKGLKHSLVRMLDVGVGANCIYPIVAAVDYGWQVKASDIDSVSVECANEISASNSVLSGKIECHVQPDSRHFFKNIIKPGEHYDITTCNPPFHKSLEEAQQGTDRKLANLNANRKKRGNGETPLATKAGSSKSNALNFGGQKAELWCPGGEAAFIKNMAFESRDYANQVLWFSTLISKKENVRWMRKNLEKAGALEARVVEMQQGQKISRFIAWTFKTEAERKKWLSLKC